MSLVPVCPSDSWKNMVYGSPPQWGLDWVWLGLELDDPSLPVGVMMLSSSLYLAIGVLERGGVLV